MTGACTEAGNHGDRRAGAPVKTQWTLELVIGFVACNRESAHPFVTVRDDTLVSHGHYTMACLHVSPESPPMSSKSKNTRPSKSPRSPDLSANARPVCHRRTIRARTTVVQGSRADLPPSTALYAPIGRSKTCQRVDQASTRNRTGWASRYSV